jgi:hypothetical protein
MGGGTSCTYWLPGWEGDALPLTAAVDATAPPCDAAALDGALAELLLGMESSPGE